MWKVATGSMPVNISTVAIFTRDIDGLGTPAVGFGPATAIYTGAVDDRIDLVRRWIDESRTIVALTGAWISTESGIPDFRGPQGLWTRDPKTERLSNIQHYMSDPEVRKLAWRSRLDHPAWTAEPNGGHLALVELERRGRLHALVTQ